MPHWCASAHTYIREFSNENSKLKAPRHFSGAFKPSILRAGMYAMG